MNIRPFVKKPNPVRDYLSGPGRAEQKITALEERRERYEALAMKRTGVYSGGMPGGMRRTSSVEHYVCKITDLERETARKIDELADMVWIIEYEISLMPDDRHRDILTWRYLNGWGWNEIADAMHYDRRQITRMHGEALQDFRARNQRSIRAFEADQKHVPKCPIEI